MTSASRLGREVAEFVARLVPEVTAFRHALHQAPEVGLQTPQTRAAVLARLEKTTLRVRPPLMGTDLIAELRGGGTRTICLRADMDALPIREATGRKYESRCPGAMHACGHDGHTAILVGTALTLDHFRDRLPVTVRFVFQPGEEIVCGGRELVARGACEGAEAAYALHGWPNLPVGAVAVREGPQLAAGGFFKVCATGKGCHASQPESGRNPIPCVAEMAAKLAAYHTQVRAEDGSVVSVCMVHAGDAANTIPPTATMEGTFRYLSVEAGDRIEAGIRAIVEAAAQAAGVRAEVTFDRAYALPVINTAEGVARVEAAARAGLPAEAWRPLKRPAMGNEDFAFYLDGRQGAMFFLGLGETSPAIHTPAFDFNDECLAAGIRMMSLIALGYGAD